MLRAAEFVEVKQLVRTTGKGLFNINSNNVWKSDKNLQVDHDISRFRNFDSPTRLLNNRMWFHRSTIQVRKWLKKPLDFFEMISKYILIWIKSSLENNKGNHRVESENIFSNRKCPRKTPMELKYSVIINLLTCTIREERHRQYGTALQMNWWTNQRKGTRAVDKPPSKIVKLSSSTMFVWQKLNKSADRSCLSELETSGGKRLAENKHLEVTQSQISSIYICYCDL